MIKMGFPLATERGLSPNDSFMSSMLVRPLEQDPLSIRIVSEMLALPGQMAAEGKDFLSLGAGSPAATEALAPFLVQLRGIWNDLGDELFTNPATWAAYPPPEGLLELRQRFAGKTNQDLGRNYFTPADIVITSGGQQALDIIRDAFSLPGNVVFTAAPSYLGALANFENSQVIVAGVKIDAEGMDPDHLKYQAKKAKELGKRSRFVYLNPTLANPSAEIMPVTRRKELYHTAEELRIAIAEDDPYQHITNPDVVTPLPIVIFDAENQQTSARVIYVNSESKEFAPGVRIGYIACKDPIVRERFVRLKSLKDLGSPLITQLFLAKILAKQELVDKITANYAKVSHERQLLMLTALKEVGAENYLALTPPQGGLFFYVTALDPRISMVEIREELHQGDHPAEIVSSPACYPSENEFNPPPPQNAARLNFTAMKRERIRDGVERFMAKVKAAYDQLPSIRTGVSLPTNMQQEIRIVFPN